MMAKGTVTLRTLKRILAPNMVVTLKDGEYRVNFKGGREATAYYTTDSMDALKTGVQMEFNERRPPDFQKNPGGKTQFPLPKNGGLTVDPVGAQVTMRWRGKELLGDVVGVRRDSTTGAWLLKVKHFDGTPWPIEPNIGAVEVLERNPSRNRGNERQEIVYKGYTIRRQNAVTDWRLVITPDGELFTRAASLAEAKRLIDKHGTRRNPVIGQTGIRVKSVRISQPRPDVFHPPYNVQVDSERDNVNIWLSDRDDKSIAHWHDDDARQMIEDGFFSDKGGKKLADSVVEYARSMGWVK